MTYSFLCFSLPKCDDSPCHDFNSRAKVKDQKGEIQVHQDTTYLEIVVIFDDTDSISNRGVHETNPKPK